MIYTALLFTLAIMIMAALLVSFCHWHATRHERKLMDANHASKHGEITPRDRLVAATLVAVFLIAFSARMGSQLLGKVFEPEPCIEMVVPRGEGQAAACNHPDHRLEEQYDVYRCNCGRGGDLNLPGDL